MPRHGQMQTWSFNESLLRYGASLVSFRLPRPRVLSLVLLRRPSSIPGPAPPPPCLPLTVGSLPARNPRLPLCGTECCSTRRLQDTSLSINQDSCPGSPPKRYGGRHSKYVASIGRPSGRPPMQPRTAWSSGDRPRASACGGTDGWGLRSGPALCLRVVKGQTFSPDCVRRYNNDAAEDYYKPAAAEE